MSNIAIRVEGLSKQYHIGGPRKTYDRFGEQLADMVRAPFRRAGKLLRGQATGAAELDETFLALDNVCFEVKVGEVVGIIGRNGAGKSTLLKILSRITEPTSGYADLYGRVSSLLEVGTGFHPELTGRENVYLNGAILGMRKKEIEQKFDEIVAFSEIERFIDTPVKHYSSGMYVRLAFAVASHLEPEILLVDEVLAVGDVAFQRKCLSKMDDVARQGRTVLFVSHNMGVIQALCQRGIFLYEGEVQVDCPIAETVEAYLQTLEQAEMLNLAERTDRKGAGEIRLTQVELVDGSGRPTRTLAAGRPVKFNFQTNNVLPRMSCVFTIYDHLGQALVNFNSAVSSPVDSFISKQELGFVCEIDELMLLPGRYRINVAIEGDGKLQDHIEAAAIFDVEEGQIAGRPVRRGSRGSVTMKHSWVLPA